MNVSELVRCATAFNREQKEGKTMRAIIKTLVFAALIASFAVPEGMAYTSRKATLYFNPIYAQFPFLYRPNFVVTDVKFQQIRGPYARTLNGVTTYGWYDYEAEVVIKNMGGLKGVDYQYDRLWGNIAVEFANTQITNSTSILNFWYDDGYNQSGTGSIPLPGKTSTVVIPILQKFNNDGDGLNDLLPVSVVGCADTRVVSSQRQWIYYEYFTELNEYDNCRMENL